ncbi:MAG: DUF2914 domain-containing protein [Myxococcaceae bacterium]
MAANTTKSFAERIQAYREEHEKAEIAVFFLAGFLFDVFTLSRIDDWLTLGQQAAYLFVLGMLLAFEQRYELNVAKPPSWLTKAWRFSKDAIHFLFGSLLSSFALFYFKSASGLAALAFLAVLFSLLLANELPRFRSLGPSLRFGLYAFCLVSYFAYLLPMLVGRVRAVLFVSAVAISAVPLLFLYRKLASCNGAGYALKVVGLPGVGVLAALLGLYFVRAIPPVPLSVQFMGIYHGVEKDSAKGNYRLYHQRPDWRLWHNGDQLFVQRPGDLPYTFVRVFAPNRFVDSVRFRWSHDDPAKGWTDLGLSPPVKLTGGRDQGFRLYRRPDKAWPGNWRVQVETEDGRTIGFVGFRIEAAPPDAAEPVYRVDRR